MTDEYTKEEIDQMIDDIFTAEKQIRVATCLRCGREFRTEKKAPKICPACRSTAMREASRKGGRKSGRERAAKTETEEAVKAEAAEAVKAETAEAVKAETADAVKAEAAEAVKATADQTATTVQTTGAKYSIDAAAQKETAAEAEKTAGAVLTLGTLRRLLDNVDDGAVITIDGRSVTTFYVEHYYDLEAGVDTLRVDFGV